MFKDTYIISDKNKNTFNKDNANIIFEDGIFNANFSNVENLYIDASLSSDLKRTILQKAGLTIKEYTFKKDDIEIKAYSKASLNSQSKYTQTEKGYEAQDIISHATLDVEEVARFAFENTKCSLINIDYSSNLLSSNIWRKVVNNINEDYPNIELININIQDLETLDITNGITLLLDPIIAPIAVDNILKKGFGLSTAYTCPNGATARLFNI